MPKRLAIVTAAFALALAPTALVACGGDDDSGDTKAATGKQAGGAEKLERGVTLTLWTMPNSPKPKEDLQKMVAPFTAKTGVKVDVQEVGWDVQFDRIRNAAVSGEGPDVTQAGTTQVPFFATLGGFDDIGDRVGDIGGAGAYPSGVWQTTQVKGREGTWSVPWFTEARAIYYRKDVLERAGVDPKTAFRDWDAFRKTLETIKQKVPRIGGKPIEPFGGPGKKAFDLVHHVMPFVWDAGGAELNSEATKSTIASPQAQEGVRFMADLVKDGLFDSSQLERDGTQVENQFKGGRLAVWIGGPWVLQSAGRAEDDQWVKAARDNVGIAPMPAGPSGDAYTFVGGSNLMLLKNAKNKDAAWELMRYLSDAQVQTRYADLMGMFPSRADAQKQAGQASENHAQFLKAIEQGRTYSPVPQWAQIENAYKSRFGNILDRASGKAGSLDQAALEQELRNAEKEANGLLAQSTG